MSEPLTVVDTVLMYVDKLQLGRHLSSVAAVHIDLRVGGGVDPEVGVCSELPGPGRPTTTPRKNISDSMPTAPSSAKTPLRRLRMALLELGGARCEAGESSSRSRASSSATPSPVRAIWGILPVPGYNGLVWAVDQ
jgi:hypothetical protein